MGPEVAAFFFFFGYYQNHYKIILGLMSSCPDVSFLERSWLLHWSGEPWGLRCPIAQSLERLFPMCSLRLAEVPCASQDWDFQA